MGAASPTTNPATDPPTSRPTYPRDREVPLACLAGESYARVRDIFGAPVCSGGPAGSITSCMHLLCRLPACLCHHQNLSTMLVPLTILFVHGKNYTLEKSMPSKAGGRAAVRAAVGAAFNWSCSWSRGQDHSLYFCSLDLACVLFWPGSVRPLRRLQDWYRLEWQSALRG